LKHWNKLILICFLYAHNHVLPKDKPSSKSTNKESEYWKKEADRLKFENEDALIELQVKELQREIEQEKVEILSKERPLQDNFSNAKIQKKKNRTSQNILLPGLGSINSGEKWKGALTLSMFGFLVFSTYTNLQHANAIRRELDSLYYLEYLEQIRLNNEYKISYYRTNFFLVSTIAFYIINLIESNSWDENTSSTKSLLSPIIAINMAYSHSYLSEKNYSVHWQFSF
jgi:hypothetical protein